jgi:hypothetical protein
MSRDKQQQQTCIHCQFVVDTNNIADDRIDEKFLDSILIDIQNIDTDRCLTIGKTNLITINSPLIIVCQYLFRRQRCSTIESLVLSS